MANAEYYRNLCIRTAPKGHEAAYALFQQAGLTSDDPIIDLGAGEGAFTARLQDAGFRHLSAVEIESGRFTLDVPCYAVDLNSAFAEALPGPAAAVTALEIIEHLENPTHFLRECRRLVRPGGYLLLSTPNIAMAEGRLRFLRHGVLTRFTDQDIEGMGHISPLPENLLRYHISRTGWAVAGRALNLPRAFAMGSREHPLLKPLWAPMLAVMKGGEKLGDMLIYLLRNPAS